MTQVSGMTTIGRATSDIRKGRRVILREVQSNDFGWLYAISTASATGFRISKDDLVPTEYNLRESYRSFSEFEQVCSALTSSLNSRVHSVTKCVPNEALKTESEALHAIPDAPYTAAFGESRRVSWSATVSYRSARYSVPDYLADTQVWVRSTGTEVVIVAGKGTGATEVARHPLLGPGQASILEEHYPNHAGRDPLHRIPRPTRPSEEAFLAIGEGAKLYLVEACSSGARLCF